MRQTVRTLLLVIIVVAAASTQLRAQTSAHVPAAPGTDVPWSAHDLVEPATLAARLSNHERNLPIILNIGAVEDIKGAYHIGPVNKPENLARLQSYARSLAANAPVIIYCGCCPFAHCPNIRPAYLKLKKLGFTHVAVLNLPVNLKTNWIAKNYPLAPGK